MPSKKTTMIREESSVEDQDQKAVLVYRVGKLEEATVKGFGELKEQLLALEKHYVTKQQLEDSTKNGDMKHREQDNRLNKLESWNEWAVKIVFAIIISAVLAVIIAKPTIGG